MNTNTSYGGLLLDTTDLSKDESVPMVTSDYIQVSAAMKHLTTTIMSAVSNATNISNIVHNITVVEENKVICTPPAYHEFPPDAFNNFQRSHGAIFLHLILVIYMFIALAIVCDEYFVTSLDKICQKLGMSEDVAGATFMAAGSSAPELFTAIIGVFITKGDVGIGTIVGSAVFNILFVIGVCGVLVGEVITLSWWSLCRDSVYYSFAVVVLIMVVCDGVVTWYESLIMLVLYVLYIVIMRFNIHIQAWVTKKLDRIVQSNILPMNGTAKTFQGDYEVFTDDDDDVFMKTSVENQVSRRETEMPPDEYAKSTQIKPGFIDFIWRLMMMKRFKPKTRFMAAAYLILSYRRRMLQDEAYIRRQQFRKMAHKSSVISYTRTIRGWFNVTLEGDDYDWWRKVPNIEEGVWTYAKWAMQYPLRCLLYYTVPDCRKDRWDRWFMATFVLSIVWIALFSYIMVWMVTIIGYTLSIPDSVMGITFLAAGTSIPDAMASVFVAKQGLGDMAVSNLLGSNVFDILLGLSLPWFLKTGVAYAGSTVHINSNGMLYSILLLFLTVIATIGVLKYTGWRLNRFVGMICLFVYAIYLLFSVMIECNVFGFVNPPMCV
ncbi:sodium/potassium/calcium exchanger 4-like [Ylistrum balloti]|uniref:sodium/potassium/calcium exchanger 4-like n=1 Tax=Ylistrum balloti TaxID=509963 RepID=UPI0029059B29|nr:sodium/potassium/calcium exchanger 4-like [Ylistrum balloti]